MPTVSLRVWPSKREPDGKCPVYLVFSHRGERAVMSLPVRLRPSEWNDRTGEVRKSSGLHRQINQYLTEMTAIAIVMPADGPSFGMAPSGTWT